MGLIQNVAVIALFSGAYMSNPDEESFKKFLEIEYRKYFKVFFIVLILSRGRSSWLEAKIASIVASNLIKRDVIVKILCIIYILGLLFFLNYSNSIGKNDLLRGFQQMVSGSGWLD